MKKSPTFPFKSAAGRAAYHAAYQRMLSLWPARPEPIDVPTCVGSTHINVCGPHDGPPLFLLHGFNVSSTMWAANIGPLSQRFRTYAIDIIGDFGLSIPHWPINTVRSLMVWLTDLLDALGLAKAHVMGMSYGGWLAANFALHAPHRVDKLVLLAPGGTLLSINPIFLLQAVPIALWPNHYFTNYFFKWASVHRQIDDPTYHTLFNAMIDQAAIGERYFKRLLRTIIPKMSDTQLRYLTAPTLLLIGRQEVLYNPVRAINRARWLIPNLQAELLPTASHDLVFAQSHLINRRLLEFLC
ncbi:MAG: alpha/beta hydrolase [Anaerolineae bacterium]|nr:alpha/beta hydrolase [Anaerolineae bacterium]MCB9107886.1 alpha/beta hydrolase [Anaerolineales bacterium]